MKANELRIGNWIISPIEGEAEIASLGITWQSTHPEYYEPISLTKEWLLNFGFVRKEYIMLAEIHVDYCLNNLSVNIQSQWIYFKQVQIMIKLLYVHQLQNLYFALTGEELILNQ